MEQKYTIIRHAKGKKKSKINKILLKDYSDFYFWDYEEQTKIKHKVLSNYLKVWFTKLGVGNQYINYYDGFSGCGAYYDYHNDEIGWGSPIIACKTAIETKRYGNCNFYFNEGDKSTVKNLQSVLSYHNLMLKNISFSKEIFNENINTFLNNLERNPRPTFFMIDPYGIDVNFDIIKRILKIPRTEILLNFMYNFFNRFITEEKEENAINSFFGCSSWQKYRALKENAKETALRDFYRNKLKEICKYVYQYRISFADKNKTYYYLVHMTHNIDGCSIMKEAFASVNFGNVEFLGPNQPNSEQGQLFDINETKISNLRNVLFKEYKGQSTPYINILEKYIDSTPYLERHIRDAIKSMDKNFLDIQHIKSTTTVKKGDIINFYTYPKYKATETQISLF